MKKLLLILLFLVSSPAFTIEQRWEEAIGNSPEKLQGVWQSGWQSYLSSCASGKCSCVVALAEEQGDGVTAKMWVGSIARGTPQTMFENYVAMANRGYTNGHSGWDRSYNRKLQKCTRRNGAAQKSASGCQTKGGKMNSCLAYEQYARHLGLTPGKTLYAFYFGAVLDGPFRMHDMNTQCSSGSCKTGTWGCIGVTALAMKKFCVDYIGSDENTGIQSDGIKNGVYFVFKNISGYQKKGSVEQAQKGFKKILSDCSDVTISSLDENSTSNGGTWQTKIKLKNDSSSTTTDEAPHSRSIARSSNKMNSLGQADFYQNLVAGIAGLKSSNEDNIEDQVLTQEQIRAQIEEQKKKLELEKEEVLKQRHDERVKVPNVIDKDAFSVEDAF